MITKATNRIITVLLMLMLSFALIPELNAYAALPVYDDFSFEEDSINLEYGNDSSISLRLYTGNEKIESITSSNESVVEYEEIGYFSGFGELNIAVIINIVGTGTSTITAKGVNGSVAEEKVTVYEKGKEPKLPEVKFIDRDGTGKVWESGVTDYNQVHGQLYSLDKETYYVSGHVVVPKRMYVNRNSVRIIFKDGATLEALKGIHLKEGQTLFLYGQKEESGKLICGTWYDNSVPSEHAAIGGCFKEQGGTLNVHGVHVEAYGGSSAAGIGGGRNGGAGAFFAYSGYVKAVGGEDSDQKGGAGIGAGRNRGGGYVKIYGGEIEAYGAHGAAGIGGGHADGEGQYYQYGGSVKAYGGVGGAGIGSGRHARDGLYSFGMHGGTLYAQGGDYAAGIGGGQGSSGNLVSKISNGDTTAIAGRGSDEVHAFGNGQYVTGSDNRNVGHLNISDDAVIVKAGINKDQLQSYSKTDNDQRAAKCQSSKYVEITKCRHEGDHKHLRFHSGGGSECKGCSVEKHEWTCDLCNASGLEQHKPDSEGNCPCGAKADEIWHHNDNGDYLIYTETDWNRFCDMYSTISTYGKTFLLMNDISVSRFFGDKCPNVMINGRFIDTMNFRGKFDGQNHTLEFNHEGATNSGCVAPFLQVHGCTITNLHVTGKITNKKIEGKENLCAGLAAFSGIASSRFENIIVSTEIHYEGSDAQKESMGGLLGYKCGQLGNNNVQDIFKWCVFDGKMDHGKDSYVGGIVGRGDKYAQIKFDNCCFLPESIPEGYNPEEYKNTRPFFNSQFVDIGKYELIHCFYIGPYSEPSTGDRYLASKVYRVKFDKNKFEILTDWSSIFYAPNYLENKAINLRNSSGGLGVIYNDNYYAKNGQRVDVTLKDKSYIGKNDRPGDFAVVKKSNGNVEFINYVDEFLFYIPSDHVQIEWKTCIVRFINCTDYDIDGKFNEDPDHLPLVYRKEVDAGTKFSDLKGLPTTAEIALKDEHKQYKDKYHFAGWTYPGNKVPDKIKSNTNIRANYTVDSMTVDFRMDDGSLIESKTYPFGTKASDISYPNPTKARNGHKTYKFKSWNPTVEKLMTDTTFTASFDEEEVHIWDNLSVDTHEDSNGDYVLEISGTCKTDPDNPHDKAITFKPSKTTSWPNGCCDQWGDNTYTIDLDEIAKCDFKDNIQLFTGINAFKIGSRLYPAEQVLRNNEPPLGHNWGEPSYEWISDGKGGYKVRATVKCKRDETHILTEEVQAACTEVKAAACEEAGDALFTADFENDVFCTQTREGKLPAKGHDWDDPTYEWTDDKTTVTAKRTCRNDSSHIENETATVEVAVIRDATCEEKGEKAYTASFSNTAFAKQSKTEEIAATGHNWGDWEITRQATEEQEGEKVRVCKTDPSHEEKEALPKKEHVHTPGEPKVENVIEGTCTNLATHDVVVYCTSEKCGHQVISRRKVIDGWGSSEGPIHDWNEGVVTTEPTCTQTGVKTYTCKRSDSHTKTEEIAALGHDFGEWIADNQGKYRECSRCDEVQRINSTDCDHSEWKTVEKVEATCTEDGHEEYYQCNKCGSYLVKEDDKMSALTPDNLDEYIKKLTIPATGHDWGEGKITNEPTCTEGGIKTYTCAHDPSHKKTEELKPAGHSPGEAVKENVVAATCEEDGGYDEVVYCSTCNEALSKEHVVTDAMGHDYGNWETTKYATCSFKGVETRVCKHDKSHKITRETAIDPDEHRYDEPEITWSNDHSEVTAEYICTRNPSHIERRTQKTTYKVLKKATCTEEGQAVYFGRFINPLSSPAIVGPYEMTSLPALGHDWEEATCTEPKTCKRCKATEGKALGHTEVVIPAVAATCKEYGKTEGKKCSVCDEILKAPQAVAALGHDWKDVEHSPSDVEPTCTKDGYKVEKKCSRCDATIENTLVRLGHDYQEVAGSAVEPTCTKDGKEADKECSRCKDKIEGAKIDKLGHDYQEVAGSAVEPTCTKDGKESDKKCSRCTDVIKGEVIEKLGHDYEEIEGTGVEPTCTADGREADMKCSRCEDIVEGKAIEKTGHIQVTIVGLEPTCTLSGLTDKKICDSCGITIEEAQEIPALGHKWAEIEGTAKDASCTEEGKEADKECSVCGAVEEGETIDPLGHDWSDWEITEATCIQQGTEKHVCKRDPSHTHMIILEIDENAHDWGEPTYEWSDDNSSVTATRVCKNDASHVETETVNTTSEVTKEATENEEGVRTYTASFKKEGFETQTKTESIPKLDHDDEITYRNTEGNGTKWTKGSNKTAEFIFKRSENDSETFTHFTGIQVDGKDVDKANYTAESGSVIVKLKPSYLETLDAGEHTLKALFEDGYSVSVKFTILDDKDDSEKDESKTDDVKKGDVKKDGIKTSDAKTADKNAGTGKTAVSPKTGDDSYLMLWLTIFGISSVMLLANFILHKRNHGRE